MPSLPFAGDSAPAAVLDLQIRQISRKVVLNHWSSIAKAACKATRVRWIRFMLNSADETRRRWLETNDRGLGMLTGKILDVKAPAE
jgi:hypothetical protein